MKIYISGKITGDRRYKAKFREVEKKLAAAGHIVLNPATAPEGLRPVDYMRLCFAMMEAADVVLFMQDYQDSRGAMGKPPHICREYKKRVFHGTNKRGFHSCLHPCVDCIKDRFRKFESRGKT